MTNTSGTLAVAVTVNGIRTPAESRYAYSGPDVLTISTVLPAPGLAYELTSVFVTANGAPAHVVHLSQGPVGHRSSTAHAEHDPDSFDDGRTAAYEHLQHLVETLTGLGHAVGVELADDAFDELERIE